MKKIEDNNTLVFIVDIRADKKKIKNTVKMCDIQIKKVNILIRPDGTKNDIFGLGPTIMPWLWQTILNLVFLMR